ncbi:ISD11 [Auxenochlorella protothecoides x Auxenochlorella symbiontica]
MPAASEVTSLYRAILRAGSGIPNYNIREYVKRRAGEKFRELPKGGSAEAVEAAFRRGCEELEVVKRQAVVYKLYARKQKSVMELPPEGLELKPVL